MRVKIHATPKPLKEIWPQNKVVYTVECYGSNRTWTDHFISVILFLELSFKDYLEYAEMMKQKFDCVEHDHKPFFSSRRECEKAIEFLDSIIVANKLL